MKKAIILILSVIAFIIIIGETEEVTIANTIMKVVSLIWLWLVAKANNYFYEGD